MSRKTNPHVIPRFLRDNCIIEHMQKPYIRSCGKGTANGRISSVCATPYVYIVSIKTVEKLVFTPVSDGKRVVKWKGVMLKPVALEDNKFVGFSSDITAIPPAYYKGGNL